MDTIKEYKWEILLFILCVGLYYIYPSFEESGFGIIFSEALGTFVLLFVYGIIHTNEKIEWYVPMGVVLMQLISIFVILNPSAFLITVLVAIASFGGMFLGIAIGKNGLI